MVFSTPFADVLLGTAVADELFGLQGSDKITGGMGNDTLLGGLAVYDPPDSADVIFGNEGFDLLYGNGGDDWMQGGDAADTLYGGFGDDTILGGDLGDELITDGGDLVFAGPGQDNVLGGAGNDTLYGGMRLNDPDDAADRLQGGGGSDLLYGNGGDDVLLGGAGNDTLYGGFGANTLIGGEGRDTLYAVNVTDSLIGGDGVDSYIINGQMVTSEAVALSEPSALSIVDLSAGELIRITNLLPESNVRLETNGEGQAILTSDQGMLAILEGVMASELSVTITEQTSAASALVEVWVQVAGGPGAGGSGGGGGGAVNAAPALADLLTPITYLENTVNAAAQNVDTAVTLTDVDSADFDGGNVTFTYSVGGGAEDQLSINNIGVGAGQIGFAAGTVSYEGAAIGTVNGANNGANGADLIFDLNATATPTAVDALIEALQYQNTSDTPTASRTLSITIDDGDGDTSAAVTSVINVTAQNDAPVLTNQVTAVTFLENTVNAAAQLIDSDVSLTDPDSADFNTGTLTIDYTAGGGAEDQLSINNIGAGAGQIGFAAGTASYEGTAIGTINGANNGTNGADLIFDLNANATPTAVDALIEALQYQNTSNTPAASRTIRIRVADGDGGTSTADTTVINVTAQAEVATFFDPSTLDGSNGFLIEGIDAGDNLGISVSEARDVNGDGFDDIIVGANNADPGGDGSAGESYIIFGKSAGWGATFDLTTLNGTTGFRLDGIDNSDSSGQGLGAGDINGDGFADLLVGAYAAEVGAINAAGESYVIFGKAAGWAAATDLSTLNGTTGSRFDGKVASDYAGKKITSAGDVNGDGFEDILIGAAFADPGGDSRAGESYLVFGKNAGWAASLDLGTLNGTTGVEFEGIDANDRLGIDVASAGDINGDGLDDIVLGAYGGAPAGETFVIFGKTSAWAATVDVSAITAADGFRIDGVDGGDGAGKGVSSAGDINGDGFDDLIIGANFADPGGDTSAGEVYIVFGKASSFGMSLALNTLNGTNGFRLDGVDNDDFTGYSVSSAGDFNGDGLDDMLMGGLYASPGGRTYAGKSYIVFGQEGVWGASLDLSTLDGTNGFRIEGINNDDYSGESVSAAGDVNGDGFDDIIIGAKQGDPGGRGDAGESYVIFGNSGAGEVNQVGTTGDDVLSGGGAIVAGLGNDSITGAVGDDSLKGANGNDTLLGGSGDDRLYGGNGDDAISGNNDDDMIYGGDGDDSLSGNSGNDSIEGGYGDDNMRGGNGADTIVGGLGADIFRYGANGETSTTNLDVLTINFDQDTINTSTYLTDAGDTINTVGGIAANSLADIVANYDNTNMDQVGDANILTATAGTLAGNSYLIISADGNATYDEGVDLFMQVIYTGTFDIGDIV